MPMLLRIPTPLTLLPFLKKLLDSAVSGPYATLSSCVSLFGGIDMARGRHTSLTISLTAEERWTLTAWQRSTTIRAGRAKRGRILLLLADGVPISHISRMVGISRRFVYKWVKRFLQDGLDGLADKRGRGHRRVARQNDRTR